MERSLERAERPTAGRQGARGDAARTNSSAQTRGPVLDAVKLTVALLMLVGAMGGFYYYAEASVLLRVLALLAATVLAGTIAMRTEQGRLLASFVKEAQIEVRKVVWPTREETVQTTLVVLVVVVTVAIGLWLLDMVLGWIARSLTAAGG